ncbi:uncharacterized protein [Temnothorax nylanderi]|uniref:uncharacterized protein isoform X2 n=1 Tax=Temnothorax nylanderi TaxID=102681 RepID=UPI003A8B07BD
MSLQKLNMHSLTLSDQDSPEKQICEMEEEEEDWIAIPPISWTQRTHGSTRVHHTEDTQLKMGKSKKGADNKIILKKEQTVSSPFLPSYIKSYSETQIKSTIVDHTWRIVQLHKFMSLPNISMIKSPPFPDTGEYVIQINVSRQPDTKHVLKFYILTSKTFSGSCTTTITLPFQNVTSLKFVSGHISNMTLLNEISTFIYSSDTVIVRCEFEIFHDLEHKTIQRTNLTPSSTVFSKDARYFENLIFDEESKDEESMKFLVGGEYYVVSRELLYATNSSYFKNICLTHEEKEKDMTNELVTDNEVESFKQILLYITTGSIEQRYYDTLKDLLTAADKYDVPSLKLTCEHYLLHCITIYNAMELIQLALLYNAKFLGTHSATFIKFYIEEIRNTKQFRDLPQDNLIKIMELIEKSKLPEGSTHHSLLPFKADMELTFANIGV